MSTTFTQAHLTLIETAIVNKITTGSIGAGSFSFGGVTINEGTSIETLFNLYSKIKGLIDGASGNVTVKTNLDGIDV